jgi:hypothetical protein
MVSKILNHIFKHKWVGAMRILVILVWSHDSRFNGCPNQGVETMKYPKNNPTTSQLIFQYPSDILNLLDI